MSGHAIERIEQTVETVAAALFAGAVAFAVWCLFRGLGHPQLEGIVAVAFVATYLLCVRGLRALVATGPRLHLSEFAVPAFPGINFDELLLTDAERLCSKGEEPLLLEDVLPKFDPDLRVVRLFDPSAMPTAGHLKTRIDRHLGRGAVAPPDASQALFEALAELRRSLA